MKVGDIVIAKPHWDLCSGSGVYGSAIVVSVKPLILLSEWADMKWYHAKEENLEVVDSVSKARVFWLKLKRYYNEKVPW